MKRRLTIMLAVVGMLASAGIAAAAEEDPEDRDDTVFNYGYDEENHVLLWGAHPTDGLYDCSLEMQGNLIASYGLTEDGLVIVETLHDDDEAVVVFQPTPEGELSDEFEEPAELPAEYTGPGGECVVGGGVVEGPNGQVNHGMIMKLFNSVYEGPGRGCLVRHLAKSDFGKHDQQINVPDVDTEENGDLSEVDDAEIAFQTALTDCEHGNANKEDKVTGQEKAAAKKAEKANGNRGNSANAPGHNKNNGEG
ncbi:MAG TPA: hypothetical protein VFZ80_07310 [Acidimicrobiia bacterium]